MLITVLRLLSRPTVDRQVPARVCLRAVVHPARRRRRCRYNAKSAVSK